MIDELHGRSEANPLRVIFGAVQRSAAIPAQGVLGRIGARRKSQAQLAPDRSRTGQGRGTARSPQGNRAADTPASRILRMVPRPLPSAAEGAGSRAGFLRYFDLHPALALLTGVAIIALVCVIYLGQVTSVTNANYTLQRLQSENVALSREQSDLQLEIGRAQSLPEIERYAQATLGMVPIGESYTYITITNGPLTAMQPLPTPALPTMTATP